jgi:hypothetical protein
MFGFSIFTTSAPSQPSASVQDGPASNWVKSTTFTPLRKVKSRTRADMGSSSLDELTKGDRIAHATPLLEIDDGDDVG